MAEEVTVVVGRVEVMEAISEMEMVVED
jgi:hypothetical protein